MTFDEWESTHPPMQNESPNAYARRAFNAGVRSRHRIESVGDNQAECAPRYAVRLFKDALIDRFDQYPIPSQLGVTAIMKVIKQFHDGYTAPQAECAPRKYVETQPGSPNFDGAEAYEAHLNAECAPRGAQPVTEILRLLSKMHDECGTNAGQDALWDAHEAVEQLLAAPTPERAQESAGVLTDERIRAIADQYLQWGKVMYINANLNSIVTFARAVIAADKEPQP